MPELSAETKLILYYLLRNAMKEGGELEDIFQSLFVDEVETPGGEALLWEQTQKEVALFSGWCFSGTRGKDNQSLPGANEEVRDELARWLRNERGTDEQ